MVAVEVRGLPTTGVIPHLDPSELPDLIATRLSRRLDRLGYLGAFFAYAAHQPEALAGFIDFTESLKTTVRPELTELVALRVATALGNTYELAQHQRLAGRYGFGVAWIGAAQSGDVTELGQPEGAVCEFVNIALTAGGHGSRKAFARVAELVGVEEAVGVLLLLGRYVAHAHIANVLELTDPTRGTE